MSVSLSRDNILPLMANQYFTEGISVIRDTQIQRLRLDLMSVDQILHVFFPQVAANFCLFWQINIPFPILFLLGRLISVIRDT